MAFDRAEATRRSQVKPKTSKYEPYAAIDYRVIDSPAFAALRPSSVLLLLLMARQLTKENNNGHLHAAFKWCSKYGIGSEHTLRDAIAQLIAHGMIYRTRSHGANGAWARYAVTWKPIKDKTDLFLAGFKTGMWRDWVAPEKKTTRQKKQDQSSRNCSFTPEHPAESAGSRGAETADNELVPVAAMELVRLHRADRDRKPITHPLAIRLSLTADRGQLRLAA
jgi:hypothetical protein